MIKNKFKKAFTLVEMAIVLVIIGLVVSSVMVGQSLVRSAAIRAQIAQIDSIKSAKNAFYAKYNGFAGDLLCTQAMNFGLSYNITSSACTANNGDGDGILNNGHQGSVSTQIGENLLFWVQLKEAGFIQGSFSGITVGTTSASIGTIATAFLPSKLNDSASLIVFSSAGINYMGIYAISAVNGSGSLTTSGAISPIELYQIDRKIDDGLPGVGMIQARGGVVVGGAVGSGCATASGAAGAYVLSDSATSTCAMRIGFDAALL